MFSENVIIYVCKFELIFDKISNCKQPQNLIKMKNIKVKREKREKNVSFCRDQFSKTEM